MPAYYRSSLKQFLEDDKERILGVLGQESANTGFTDFKQRQTTAWWKEIQVLVSAGEALVTQISASRHWGILLEYAIPRRQKRIDAVILACDLIFCLEFKTEDKSHTRQTQRQVEDYALDLRDFHEESRGRRIVPIAVALRAASVSEPSTTSRQDLVRGVVRANASDLSLKIATAFKMESTPNAPPIDTEDWDSSPYRPVPTIIEAAEALYAGHDVREIAHSHAGRTNLTATSDKVIGTIEEAQRKRLKIACFVTGVPGAGKTLAGLNIVHNPALRQQDRPAGAFLSGNGPLVKIISAAIARDFSQRTRASGANRTVSTLIQNIHGFTRDGLDRASPPSENVIVFDEAQRAWNRAHNQRKTRADFSEPETVLSIMDRHADWAVIVALVGGGQEIHRGEAGLAEWGRSLREGFPHWKVAVSPKALRGDASVAGHCLFPDGNLGSLDVTEESALHLEVNLRSFRARRIAEWVDAVLRGDASTAARISADLRSFPLRQTRSLPTARAWLREQTRGLRRCGLVASSGAIRLRAEGIELSSGFRQGNRDMYVKWFLNDPSDVRSSNQLEVAASEFECQGLELDWVGMCWGGDLSYDPATAGWVHRNFTGNRWKNVTLQTDREYLLNKYRVLLTRAREGMVIWVPRGARDDPTTPPDRFDATASFLGECGLEAT